jgi:diacylglycerol kinase (ATP)
VVSHRGQPGVLIFSNPISGRGRGAQIARRLERRLATEGYDVKTFLKPADRVPVDELLGAQTAIVIGGDGTLRAVSARLLAAGETPPPLLIVPMGTANLMGKHLGLAWDDEHVDDQVLDVMRHGRVVELDAATANRELLLLVAGVGLDAQVVHELDKRRSGPISYLSYALPALTALGTYAYPPVTVTVDGKDVFGPAPAMVFVGNVPEYGTGFPILPLASPTDGVLDVCVLPCRSREELFELALRAAAGEHLHGEDVVYAKGKHIHVDSSEPVPVQVDGEAAGHTPLSIDLLPNRLGFMVPG